MKRLDRYFFGQLIAPFGFFSLIIVGILWLSQALPLVDKVIESGQSGLVFLEVTSLLIPDVMMIALPFAAFAAALFALNRLYAEAELVVMMTAGQSPLALAKPVAAFGMFVLVLMAITTFYLVPASQTQLRTRMVEIQTELAGSLVREGQFIHPTETLTIYVRDTSREGEMAGLFLHDQSDPDNPLTYTAQKALFLQDGHDMRIVMVDGFIQQFDKANTLLNTVRFERLSFDLGALLPTTQERNRSPTEMFPHELIFPSNDLLQSELYDLGDYISEGHHKITLPLTALVLPLIALGSIVLGGFRRGGFSRRVLFAAAIGVVLQSSVVVLKSVAQNAPSLVWTLYLPPFLGLVVALLFLRHAGRIRRAKKTLST